MAARLKFCGMAARNLKSLVKIGLVCGDPAGHSPTASGINQFRFLPKKQNSVSEKILGKVVEVTTDGDLITDIPWEKWSAVNRSSETKIIVDEEHETFGLFGQDHDQPPMTLIAIVESKNPLRLHLVSDSASMMLGVRKGAKVEIVW